MTTTAARWFRWHRWLGYLVALQVFLWVAGGLLFSWLPFKDWVKGEAAVGKVQQPLPADWAARLAGTAGPEPVLELRSVATASGPAFRVRQAAGERWWAAGGGELPAPDAAAVERFARSLYRGQGGLVAVERLERVAPRWGIVREAPPRPAIWRASFDDALATRLYFDVRSGELLAVRNDAWVAYDFFWRLHIMDYGEGEDFNHGLIRAASVAALALVASGLVLAALALRRAWRRRGARPA